MNNKAFTVLFKKCKSKNVSFAHVCEVGVYLPHTSNVIDFIYSGVKTSLVEPDPKNIKAIQSFFKDYNNIKLFPVAVFDHNGTLELVQREASTFVSSLEASPALVNDRYIRNENDKFTVECKKFDDIDDGTIELLSVDTEGCEWYVLKNMKSRPAVISIETHGKSYINPFYNDISAWIRNNNYIVWYKDNSDTVYYKAGFFELSVRERLSIIWVDFRLSFRRRKHYIKRKLGL